MNKIPPDYFGFGSCGCKAKGSGAGGVDWDAYGRRQEVQQFAAGVVPALDAITADAEKALDLARQWEAQTIATANTRNLQVMDPWVDKVVAASQQLTGVLTALVDKQGALIPDFEAGVNNLRKLKARALELGDQQSAAEAQRLEAAMFAAYKRGDEMLRQLAGQLHRLRAAMGQLAASLAIAGQVTRAKQLEDVSKRLADVADKIGKGGESWVGLAIAGFIGLIGLVLATRK
ncbi:MAG: hypothetical protein KIT75_03535 [Planctomycetota bacterium]|nr:hypothetical protein [Planctomycetota bacterium]